MPTEFWAHNCPEARGTATTSPICQYCGGQQEYDGWLLTMYENMAVYQYVYGLKPMGPHRPMADRLLTPLRRRCETCAGEGVLSAGRPGAPWRLCAVCEGTGGTWNRSSEDVEAARREVLKSFPDAAVARTPPNFVSPTLALNGWTGQVVDLRDERK